METSTESAHTFVSFNVNSKSNPDNNRTEYAYPTIVKGIPLITHLRSLKVYLELNGSSDLELGVAVRIDVKEHPNKVEYICSVCGERTIYNKNEY
jgi:DNA-dependent RNA polymerase auxiliary subunit epsilon